MGLLENKTTANPHPNIGLLKTATEEELNRMSEECVCVCMCIYIYIYTHTTGIAMMRVAVSSRKSSSNDDAWVRHGFVAESSLPLTSGTSVLIEDTAKFCWFYVTRIPETCR